MIPDAVISPYYDQATSWPRVLLCIIILLSVVLSPDIEKTHHASSKTSPYVNPPEFNGAAVSHAPISVDSTLSPCVYEDFTGSNLLSYFLMLPSMVLSPDLVTTHHTGTMMRFTEQHCDNKRPSESVGQWKAYLIQ